STRTYNSAGKGSPGSEGRSPSRWHRAGGSGRRSGRWRRSSGSTRSRSECLSPSRSFSACSQESGCCVWPSVAGEESDVERVQPERVARLPLWPLMVLFGLTPLWWALGALYLLWPIFAILLAVVLLTRGRTLAPTGTVLWLILLGIIVVSFTRLDRATSYLTSGLRLGFFFAGFVVWLYVYNLVRE